MNQTEKINAEIIAVGDEMIGGGRLDTNTQWLAQRLNELGIDVDYHTTVGDDLARQASVFRNAAKRADLVVVSGGLGPTADDLTRNVLAEVVQRPLIEHPDSLVHIQNLFAKYGREMPDSNRVQAMFPDGSTPIPNAEGSAPGIDCRLVLDGRPSRFFCLPGVPYEMKEMWNAYVQPEICQQVGGDRWIETRVLNCFGQGESHIETLLGDLISRGKNPVVGITASQATISLRIVARGKNQAECWRQIEPVEAFIRAKLGDLVFGSGDETLEDVALRRLKTRDETLSLIDRGLGGGVAHLLSIAAQQSGSSIEFPNWLGGMVLPPIGFVSCQRDLECVANLGPATWRIAIAPIVRNLENEKESVRVVISGPKGVVEKTIPHAGHSSIRMIRSHKGVLRELIKAMDESLAPKSAGTP